MGFPVFQLTVRTMLVHISLLVRLFLLCIKGIIECRWEAFFFSHAFEQHCCVGNLWVSRWLGSTGLVHMKSSQKPQCPRSVILIHDLLEMICDFPSGKSITWGTPGEYVGKCVFGSSNASYQTIYFCGIVWQVSHWFILPLHSHCLKSSTVNYWGSWI